MRPTFIPPNLNRQLWNSRCRLCCVYVFMSRRLSALSVFCSSCSVSGFVLLLFQKKTAVNKIGFQARARVDINCITLVCIAYILHFLLPMFYKRCSWAWLTIKCGKLLLNTEVVP